MKLTEADFKRLLLDTNPNRNYNVDRAATILYLHHVKGMTYLEIAEHLKLSYAIVQMSELRAENKLRVCWPLFAQRDVNKMYANESLARAVWPLLTRSGAARMPITT